jgi:hypothetical protein
VTGVAPAAGSTAVAARPGGAAGPAAAVAAVTGWSVHLPGGGDGGDGGDCPPDRAHELLGRKGLLGKEPATRLALCAVHRALGRPAREPRPAGTADPRTAVVVASNLGNVGTVAGVAATLRRQSVRAVSPLDAPNASSNVIASAVAIWFRFGGPNLMICSGATAGLDAVGLAGLLLRAGRADRVVVVGAEPDDPVAAAVHRARAAAPPRPLVAGAGCAVLERPDRAGAGGVLLGPVTVTGGPAAAAGGEPAGDLCGAAGDLYGAAGVVRLARAAELVGSGRAGATEVVDGDPGDGWRSVAVWWGTR